MHLLNKLKLNSTSQLTEKQDQNTKIWKNIKSITTWVKETLSDYSQSYEFIFRLTSTLPFYVFLTSAIWLAQLASANIISASLILLATPEPSII